MEVRQIKKEVYIIEGMHCAACSASVEKVTGKLQGVKRSEVNLTTGKLTIEYDEALVTPEMVMQKVEKAGFKALPDSKKKKQQADEKTELRREKANIAISLALAAVMLYVSMGTMLFRAPLPDIIDMMKSPLNFAFTQMLLALIIMLIGRRFYISGFKAIFHRSANMDSLVAIGSSAAFIYSAATLFTLKSNPENVHNLYFESAAVVVALVSLGKYMENVSKRKTTGAIKKLMELAPDTAILVEGTQQRQVKTDTLKVGDTVIVKPGARVPLDGEVVRGESGVDESMLTGESMPVFKTVGSEVIGGSINGNGVLYVKIMRVGENTALAKIIKFVEDAQGKKAPISKTADKVAGVFVPAVIAVAAVSAAIWLLCGKDTAFAVKIATAVLVIACPCAMGLATPAAIVVGTGVGAGRGILIRSGEALEITHKATVVLLDKTGTVTNGEPVVTNIISHKISAEELLCIAAAAEEASQHPIASSIVAEAKKKGVYGKKTADEFVNIPGKGISARLQSGETVLAGNEALMQANSLGTQEYDEALKTLSECGETPVLAAVGGEVVGIISVADTVKESSADAVARLKKMGLKVVLLTGDNKAAAEYIGSLVGVHEVIAGVLPQDKAGEVEKLQKSGECVIMVGDGINDAPALTKADIGCAIGGGSDIAVDCADIVLMRNDLCDVARAMRLSRLTMRNIKQNLFWAFCYNTVGIPIAAGVLYPLLHMLLSPMIGALAMSLSSVCVVTNALRLRNIKLD